MELKPGNVVSAHRLVFDFVPQWHCRIHKTFVTSMTLLKHAKTSPSHHDEETKTFRVGKTRFPEEHKREKKVRESVSYWSSSVLVPYRTQTII